jgi:Family of unknown function (DUF5947)
MSRVGKTGSARGLASLRNFVRKPPEVERCDLCSAVLVEHHQHLLDPQTRRLLCACDPCAILFNSNGQTRYRRVPRDVIALSNFVLSDQGWNGLAIPIGLAFIYSSALANEIVAVYPSPAGPTESALDQEAWNELVAENPAVLKLTPDVEALLINRLDGAREYFLVPIDECYKLTGIVRKYWRGFSGGDEAFEQISAFFDRLKETARSVPVSSYVGSFV